jgi:hypothetical protein
MLETLLVLALVFASAVAGDYVEARYTAAVARRDAKRAPMMSVAMYLNSVISMLAFVESESHAVKAAILVLECVGVWWGTRIAVRRQIREHEKEIAIVDEQPRLRAVA